MGKDLFPFLDDETTESLTRNLPDMENQRHGLLFWANNIIMQWALIQNVKKGNLAIADFHPVEGPMFQNTKQGNREGDVLLREILGDIPEAT